MFSDFWIQVCKLMKQSVHRSQPKMLVSVLPYTFRETQYTNTTTDVQFITTLKNITVRKETLSWAEADGLKQLQHILFVAQVILL